jgi:hypothetical protein
MMKQHRLKRIALLLGVALLIGLTCAGSEAKSTLAPSIGELTAADVIRLAEVKQLLARFGREIWPGWSQSPPLLLRKGEFDYLIGHPSPPEAFERIPGASIGAQPVYRRMGHLVPVPAATTWEVTGVWCVAVPASIPTGPRDRYAILGAGEAFLLDRLMPDWKAKAIPGKTALEELFAEVAGTPARN